MESISRAELHALRYDDTFSLLYALAYEVAKCSGHARDTHIAARFLCSHDFSIRPPPIIIGSLIPRRRAPTQVWAPQTDKLTLKLELAASRVVKQPDPTRIDIWCTGTKIEGVHRMATATTNTNVNQFVPGTVYLVQYTYVEGQCGCPE